MGSVATWATRGATPAPCAPLCKWDKPSERSFRIGREERWRGRRTTRSRGAGRGQMVARGWTKGPGIHQSKKGATFAGLGQPSGRPRPRIFSRIAARGWSCFGLRTSPSKRPLRGLRRPGRAAKGPRNILPPRPAPTRPSSSSSARSGGENEFLRVYGVARRICVLGMNRMFQGFP